MISSCWWAWWWQSPPYKPYPIGIFTGLQGSGKTTRARAIIRITDPSTAELVMAPKEDRDVLASTSARWLTSFDNVEKNQPLRFRCPVLCVHRHFLFGAGVLYDPQFLRNGGDCPPNAHDGSADQAQPRFTTGLSVSISLRLQAARPKANIGGNMTSTRLKDRCAARRAFLRASQLCSRQ